MYVAPDQHERIDQDNYFVRQYPEAFSGRNMWKCVFKVLYGSRPDKIEMSFNLSTYQEHMKQGTSSRQHTLIPSMPPGAHVECYALHPPRSTAVCDSLPKTPCLSAFLFGGEPMIQNEPMDTSTDSTVLVLDENL
eukprot:1149626-Pelagomonas_calceolata.AAC.6